MRELDNVSFSEYRPKPFERPRILQADGASHHQPQTAGIKWLPETASDTQDPGSYQFSRNRSVALQTGRSVEI